MEPSNADTSENTKPSKIRRRTVVCAVLSGVYTPSAGCLDQSHSKTPIRPATTGENQTQVATVPQGCSESSRAPTARTEPSSTPIPQLPDPPGAITKEAVTEYAETYEFVYRWRTRADTLPSPITELNLDAVVEVRERGADWMIVDITGRLAGKWDPDPDETDSSGSFDGVKYRASYLVTAEAVWRAEARDGPFNFSTPDPARDGTLVECFAS